MRKRNVADVNPENQGIRVDEGVRGLLAMQKIVDNLTGSVNLVNAVNLLQHGTVDQSRINGGTSEIGLFLLDKIPKGLLSKLLGSTVRGCEIGGGLLPSKVRPGGLVVNKSGVILLVNVDDRSIRRSDDNL